MLLVDVVLLYGWREIQNRRVTERMAPMLFLQKNGRLGIWLFGIMTAIFSILAYRQILWITLAPWIFSLVNALSSNDRGMNTALGKSPQEMSEEEEREQKLARGETI